MKSAHGPAQALPAVFIKFHLSEAQRVFRLDDFSQALYHCEEVLLQDPTNAEASQLHDIIRYEWQDYLGVTPDSLFSFLWTGKKTAKS